MRIKKHTLFAFVLLAITPLLLLSCRENPAVSNQLRNAESLIENRPDSALLLLQEMDSIGGFNKSQRAQWNLLTTWAKDKAKIKPANDSLIREAVNYYTQADDPYRLMQALYYKGRINRELKDAPRAQEHFLSARENAVIANDALYLARINSNIGALYLYQELPEEALPYLSETKEYFIQQNDSANIHFATRDLGRAYSLLRDDDNTLSYYGKALTYTAMPKQKVALLNEMIPLYINKGDYASAYTYLQEIHRLSKDSLSLQSNLVSGQYFAKTNQPDSANYYLKKCINVPQIRIRATAHYHLYQMARKMEDWKNFDFHEAKYELLRDSIMKNTYTEKVLQLETLYNFEKKEKEAIQAKLDHVEEKKKKTRFIWLSIFAAFLVILIFLYYTNRLRSQKKEWEGEQRLREEKEKEREHKIQENIKQIDHNNQIIEILKNQLKHKEENEEELQELIIKLENENTLLKAKTKPTDAIDERLTSSPLFQKFCDAEEELSKNEINEFMALIDQIYPSFRERLYEHDTSLSKEEYRICYLTKGRLINRTIAIIMGQSKSNLGNKKRALCKRFYPMENKSVTLFDSQISQME